MLEVLAAKLRKLLRRALRKKASTNPLYTCTDWRGLTITRPSYLAEDAHPDGTASVPCSNGFSLKYPKRSSGSH